MTLEYSSRRYYWSIGDLTRRSLLGCLPLVVLSTTMPKCSLAKRDFRDYGDNGERKIKKSEEGAARFPLISYPDLPRPRGKQCKTE